MIKQDSIERIKENASIVEVIGRFVELKRKGTNHVGCCPFHGEKTPSFTVNEAKGMFKCFGCDASGDVYEFLTKHSGLEFAEAVKETARLTGQQVEFEKSNLTPEQQAERRQLEDEQESLFAQNAAYWELLWSGIAWYFEGLPETTKIDVDGSRTYTIETIKEFGLVAAPLDNWLVKEGKKAGFTEKLLLAGHLIKQGQKGRYDTFRGRLLFPIYTSSHGPNRRGKIAGFGGRSLDASQRAKYINSDESPIYSKGKILYGLHQTKTYFKEAKPEGSAYLVEGYTDALTMYEAGFKNVVAKCGTALTIEQASSLKRSASEIVLVPDCDPKFSEEGTLTGWPGLDASRRDIDTCLEAGLHVKILILPIRQDKRKSDPDSFIREHGRAGFKFLVDENTQDGIEWRISDILSAGTDKATKELAAETAAGMLAKIKSDYLRAEYIKTLCSAKFLKTKEALLSEMVLNKQMSGEKRSQNGHVDLTPAQQESYYKYGFYIGNDGQTKKDVFMTLDGYMPVRLSNFIIEPEYHVFSETSPERKIRAINYKGLTRIVDLHTDTFEEFKPFCKAMGALGNFRFTQHCKGPHFHGIVTWLYENMPSVLRIEKLGQHSTGEMYVWGNGVTLPDGTFVQKQENGLIAVGGETYRIPGRTDQDEQKKKLDSLQTTDSYLENFIYVPGDCPTWTETLEKIYAVHGENGMVGIAYYLLCLFRSEIYPDKTQEFPILNGTGPPRKGKTQLWWLLSSFFGLPENPVNLSNVTQFGFSQMLETRRDALIGLDEYKNGLDKWKIEAIKDISDGAGRLKGSGKDKISLSKSQVLSGVYLFGQDLPTADIAALTRMVTCWFQDFDRENESITAFEDLKKLRQTGVFSQHTSRLQKHRLTVRRSILEAFYHCKGELKKEFEGNTDERVMNTHSWILAIIWVLQDCEKFPELEPGKTFFESLFVTVTKFARRQLKYISKEDENAGFWSILQNQTMVEKTIRHKEHFWVSIEDGEKFYETETSRDTRVATWEKPKKLIYLNVDLLYEAYKKGFKGDTDGKKPLPKESLIGYLEMDAAYLGNKKAKKLGGVARTVMVFNIGTVEGEEIYGGLSDRAFNLPTNSEARTLGYKKEQEEENDEPGEAPAEEGKEDLPF